MFAIALAATVTMVLYQHTNSDIHIHTCTGTFIISPSYPSSPLRLHEGRQQRVMGDGITRWGTWLA